MHCKILITQWLSPIDSRLQEGLANPPGLSNDLIGRVVAQQCTVVEGPWCEEAQSIVGHPAAGAFVGEQPMGRVGWLLSVLHPFSAAIGLVLAVRHRLTASQARPDHDAEDEGPLSCRYTDQ